MAKHQAQNLAYNLYMAGELTQKEIADKVGVTEKTVKEWVKKGNWKEIRVAKKSTRDETVRALLEQLQETVDQNEKKRQEGNLKPADIDAQYKISCTIEKINEELALRNYVQVFEDFVKWLSPIDPKLANQFSDKMYDFLQEKAGS